MTGAEDSTDRAAELVACPECGEADYVKKLSAIPDMPAEYCPPDQPSAVDWLGVVLILVPMIIVTVAVDRWGFLLLVGILMTGPALLYVIAAAVALVATPVGYGVRRLLSKQEQKLQWQKGMRFWKRLYFCPRDEVVFIPGGTSVVPLRKIRHSFYAHHELAGHLVGKQMRFADFSPMPEEFVDFERMLEEAKEKSGTLICFGCGHENPVGQTWCQQCGAWVPQTAKARWAYGKDK